MAGKGDNIEQNKAKIAEQIRNGKAFEKLKEQVQKQGGDVSYIEDISKFPKANLKQEIIAGESGYLEEIDARKIGEASCMLGAGRIKKEDEIDKTVGIRLLKKKADYVEKGEVLAILYANDKQKLENALMNAKEAYKIGDEKPEVKTILGII